MNKETKQRNVIITVILWLAILVNLAMTIGSIVLMYDAKAMEVTLGFGLSSMFTFANVLGAILLMRWNKNGLILMAISGILLSIVYGYVLNCWIVETIPFIGAVAVLLLILQIRKGGKSAWSQLKSGWDGKHCRHIYQIFAVVELALFILTIIEFGGKNGNQNFPHPNTVLHDTIVDEKQDLVKDISRESIPSTNSVKNERPVIDAQDKKPSIETPTNMRPSENNATPEKSSQKTYSLDDAAKYLDTHIVWVVSEMNQYPDLCNLSKLMEKSLYTCRNLLPSALVSKSQRLGEISKLLKEAEYRYRGYYDKRNMSRLRSQFHKNVSSDIILPYQIRNLLREIIDEARCSNDQSMKQTTLHHLMKSPQKREALVALHQIGKTIVIPANARKKRNQKEIDDYKKMVSDSVNHVPPTFGLG